MRCSWSLISSDSNATALRRLVSVGLIPPRRRHVCSHQWQEAQPSMSFHRFRISLLLSRMDQNPRPRTRLPWSNRPNLDSSFRYQHPLGRSLHLSLSACHHPHILHLRMMCLCLKVHNRRLKARQPLELPLLPQQADVPAAESLDKAPTVCTHSPLSSRRTMPADASVVMR